MDEEEVHLEEFPMVKTFHVSEPRLAYLTGISDFVEIIVLTIITEDNNVAAYAMPLAVAQKLFNL